MSRAKGAAPTTALDLIETIRALALPAELDEVTVVLETPRGRVPVRVATAVDEQGRPVVVLMSESA